MKKLKINFAKDQNQAQIYLFKTVLHREST